MAEEIYRNNRPYYTISCVIGDIDFSSNLMSITIMNSISVPYPSIILSLVVDSKILVRKDLFGKEDVELTIQLMTEDSTPTETIELTLITIKQDVPLSPKDNIDVGGSQEQDSIVLTNIIKDPYLQMTTTVNRLFDESKQLTPIGMVEDIISTFLSGMDTDIKQDNINSETVYQYIVQPMPFINAVKYIDGSDVNVVKKYGSGLGLFAGPMFSNCRWELGGGNTYCLWDLKSILKKSAEYTISHLALGGNDDEIMEEAGVTPDKFYTTDTVKNVYRGNQDLMMINYTNKFLSKPIDSLYEWKDLTLDNVFDVNSIKDKGKILINDSLKDGVTYHTNDEVGHEYSDIPYRARISRKLSALSEIEFTVHRNLSLEKLSRVGVPIEFAPQTVDYMELGGKYIASASKIEFKRETDSWVCRVSTRAFRGNFKN